MESLQHLRQLHSQRSDHIGDRLAGIRWLKRIEWYKDRTGFISVTSCNCYSGVELSGSFETSRKKGV